MMWPVMTDSYSDEDGSRNGGGGGNDTMRVVITGAGGFVARHLRLHLSRLGVRLVSISRNDFDSLDNETKIVSRDYDDGDIISGIRGSDALIHLAGIGRQSAGADYDSVNVRLTGRLMDMCRRAQIRKVVYTSGLGVSEDTQLGYFISKLRAERLVADSGMDHTIFRPSYMVGSDDPLTVHLRGQARRGAIEIPGSGRYVMQPVYIGDVVEVIRRSVTGAGFRNRIIDLVGPEIIPFEEYVRLFSSGTGAAIRKVGLEDALREAIRGDGGRGSGSRNKHDSDNKNDDNYDDNDNNNKTAARPFAVDDLCIMVGGFVGDHDALRRISGMQFRSVRGLLESGLLP